MIEDVSMPELVNELGIGKVPLRDAVDQMRCIIEAFRPVSSSWTALDFGMVCGRKVKLVPRNVWV